MAYDIENKIQFKNLAPSLQALLTGTTSSTLKTSFENMVSNGSNGQLIKYDTDTSTLYADDDMYLLRIANTIDEVDTLIKLGPIKLEDVFNSWNRLSTHKGTIYYNGKGSLTSDMSSAYSKWSFDSTTQGIANNGNWDAFGAFISNDLYDNYWIKIRMVATDGDDDMIGFIVSAIIDQTTGFPHTLGLYAAGNNGGTEQGHMPEGCRNYPFCLVYDYDIPATQTVLAYVSYGNAAGLYGKGSNVSTYKHGGTQYLYVERKGKSIIGKASQSGSSTYNQFIEYELPDTNPGLPTETWNNLKLMLGDTGLVGFCTKSDQCVFYIDDQKELFRDDKIYVLHNGQILAYVDGAWVPVGTTDDEIPHKVWLYNPDLNTVYWYDGPSLYYKLSSDSSLIIPNIKGELLKYDGFNKLHSESNFYKIPVIDNDADFNSQKSISTNSIYNLKDGHIYIYNGSLWVKCGYISDLIRSGSWLYNENLYRYFIITGVNDDKTLSYQRLILNK